jgi:hypothetical protein
MSNFNPSSIYDLDNIYTYHAPVGDQAARYANIRDFAKQLARQIIITSPCSREQSLALTKLEEAMFWANAAVARHMKPPEAEEGT